MVTIALILIEVKRSHLDAGKKKAPAPNPFKTAESAAHTVN
jgi:hypothetical protein